MSKALRRARQSLPDRLTLLLNQTITAMNEHASGEFRALGLSIPAARALIGLVESGDRLNIGDLAEVCSLDLSTLSHILRRLTAKQFIERTRDKSDNRVVYAQLTARGRLMALRCRKQSLQHEKILLGELSASDIATLKRLLMRVCGNARNLPNKCTRRQRTHRYSSAPSF